MTAPIVNAAEEIKELLAEGGFTQEFTPHRVYIQFSRLEEITGLEVWVQPREHNITRLTRERSQNDYVVDIGIFKRCADTAATDSMLELADEIYRFLHDTELDSGKILRDIEIPTIYSPDDLLQLNLFACVITVTVTDDGTSGS